MSAPWQPPVPIQSLFKQLEDGTFFAAAGLEPISDNQVARLGYSIVLATGLFPEGCREWRLKPAPSQTYDAFRTFFRLVDSDRREAHTSSSVGYSGTANSLVLLYPTEELVSASRRSLSTKRKNVQKAS